MRVLVFEGQDATGKTTAIKKVQKYIKTDVLVAHQPSVEPPREAGVMWYVEDRINVLSRLRGHDIVLLDRNWESTLAYQANKNMPVPDIWRLQPTGMLPEADVLTIWLRPPYLIIANARRHRDGDLRPMVNIVDDIARIDAAYEHAFDWLGRHTRYRYVQCAQPFTTAMAKGVAKALMNPEYGWQEEVISSLLTDYNGEA